jgi:predicted dehydrogenase
VRTRSGASGAFQHSAGTNLKAFEWDIGYEKGTVKAAGETVTVTPAEGEPVVKEFKRTTGVAEEVLAWAAGIAEGRPNPLQSPEEALADLEFLEKMFRSGEQGGAPQKYEFQ